MACVSAALPERKQKIWSLKKVILSVERLVAYDPMDVRVSAPSTTPPLKGMARMVVPVDSSPSFNPYGLLE